MTRVSVLTGQKRNKTADLVVISVPNRRSNMTSQIVLMNQLSIALASDTLTSRNEASGETKTYPSMSKIFALESPHQLAVLHCGCTELGDAHWRMLVTEWSRTLTAPLSKVTEYADNFVAWLGATASRLGLNDDSSFRQIFFTQFSVFANVKTDEIAKALGQKGHRKSAEYASDLTQLLKAFQEQVCTEELYRDMSDDVAAKLIAKAGTNPIESFRVALNIDPDLEFSEELEKAINSFALASLVRYVDSSETVDLTFVGYGSDEYFGQISRRFFTGFYGGHARFKSIDIGSNSPSDYSYTVPLAQSRAVGPFLYGLDGEMTETIAQHIGDAASSDLKMNEKDSKELVSKAMDRISEWINDEYASPMFRTLDALGPSALARYADLLIRMESLRSATLKDEATVGGVVESLSINRSTGVEWHHRVGHDFQSIEASSHILA